MKKFSILLFLVFNFSFLTFAQTPAQFKYQAVLRDASGNILANQNKTVVIDILQGTPTGTSVFNESHSVTTTAQGLINLNIGSIENLSGIDWKADEYFIQILVDGTIMGTSQLLSVPYALQAKEVENVNYSQISGTPDLSGYLTEETDPVFSNWDKSEGISITESQISDLGNYIETETQNLDAVLTQGTSAGNKTITNLAEPVNAQDAATKAYVDILEERVLDLEVSLGLKVKDIDGNAYKIVKIGDQIWMAENLKVRHYPNGTAIPYIDNNATWAALADDNTSDAFCFYGDSNNDGTVDIAHPDYGALYTYAAAIGDNWANDNATGQGVCPDGWHLPTDAEWTTLTDFLGGQNVAGGKMKETGTTHWTSPNTDATNESGFSALPGAFRNFFDGSFYILGNYGYFWSATEGGATSALYRQLAFNRSSVDRNNFLKNYGFSVRCVRD